MRRRVARVLTTTFLLVAAVHVTKSSLLNSLSGGVGLDVDEQKTQQHAPDTAPPASSAPILITPSLSLDPVLVKPPSIPGPESSGTNGVDREAMVQDLVTETSSDGTQRVDAVLDRGTSLNSSLIPPKTTTVGLEAQQAGPTPDNLHQTVNYRDHLMLNDVNDATGNTSLTKDTAIGMSGSMPVNTVTTVGAAVDGKKHTVDAAVENMTQEGSLNSYTKLERGTPVVTSSVPDEVSLVVANTTGTVSSTLGGTKGSKVNDGVGSTVNAMTQNVDSEADDGHLTLDSVTPTVKDSVDTVSLTEGAVEQEEKRTTNSTDVPVTSIVPTLAHPVRSSLTTITNSPINSVNSLAPVDANGTTAGTGMNTLVYTVTNPAGSALKSVNDSVSKPLPSGVETVGQTTDLITQSTSNAASTGSKIVALVVHTTGSAVKMVPTVVPAALKIGSPLVDKNTDTAGTMVNTVPATAPAVVNSVTNTVINPANSAVNAVTSTISKSVASSVKTVADRPDSTFKTLSHPTSTGMETVPASANTKSTMNLRPSSVPVVVPIAHKATSTVTDSAKATVNTVTKPSSGVIQAGTPQAGKVIHTVTPSSSTVTNTIKKSVTPAVATVDKPAGLHVSTETIAAPAVYKEGSPVIDTVTSTTPKTVPSTETKRVVNEVVPGTVPTLHGTPEVSTNPEGAQGVSKPTAVKMAQPLLLKSLSTMTPPASPLTSTEQVLEKKDKRPTSSDEKEVVPSGTEVPGFNDTTENPIDSIDSQSSLQPNNVTSANNDVYDSDQAGFQDTPPPVQPSKTLSKALVPTPFAFSNIQARSSTETMGSFDALTGSLASVQSPDVGEPSMTLPSTIEAPSVAPALPLPHMLAHSPPASSSSESKENKVSQEAQAKQAANVSKNAHVGSSILFTVVGVAGCAAIVAIVAFRKKTQQDATSSTDVRSLISSADGARASLDSVYTDPLGTRYSSIVMITPNGDGVCIL